MKASLILLLYPKHSYTIASINYNHSQNIWDWLWFSYEIAHYGKTLISVFEDILASVKKILILAGGLGASLSFYEI